MEPIAIRLSNEELTILLETLEITHLAGFAIDTFESLAADHRLVIRSIVQRGLTARQMLLPTREGNFAVNNDIERLLRLCAYPDAALAIISREGNDQAQRQEFYYRLGDIVIRHYSPLAGIHEFGLINQAPDIVGGISKWLQNLVTEIDQSSSHITLPIEILNQAQEAANRGADDEAQACLMGAQMSHGEAAILASALTNPAARLQILTLSPHNESDETTTLTLLCSAHHCWSMRRISSTIMLEVVTLHVLKKRLNQIVEQWVTFAPVSNK